MLLAVWPVRRGIFPAIEGKATPACVGAPAGDMLCGSTTAESVTPGMSGAPGRASVCAKLSGSVVGAAAACVLACEGEKKEGLLRRIARFQQHRDGPLVLEHIHKLLKKFLLKRLGQRRQHERDVAGRGVDRDHIGGGRLRNRAADLHLPRALRELLRHAGGDGFDRRHATGGGRGRGGGR